MTAITFYSDDKSTLQKLLDMALGLNIRANIQPVEDGEVDVLEAMRQMDRGEYETVSNEQLFNLIHH